MALEQRTSMDWGVHGCSAAGPRLPPACRPGRAARAPPPAFTPGLSHKRRAFGYPIYVYAAGAGPCAGEDGSAAAAADTTSAETSEPVAAPPPVLPMRTFSQWVSGLSQFKFGAIMFTVAILSGGCVGGVGGWEVEAAGPARDLGPSSQRLPGRRAELQPHARRAPRPQTQIPEKPATPLDVRAAIGFSLMAWAFIFDACVDLYEAITKAKKN